MAGEIFGFSPMGAIEQAKAAASGFGTTLTNFGGQVAGAVTSLPGTIIGGASTLLQPVYNAGAGTSKLFK